MSTGTGPSRARPDLARQITDLVTEEVANALRLPRRGLAMRLVGTAAQRVTRRFAGLAAQFDADTATIGITRASRAFVAHFTDKAVTRGADHIPATGPLIIAANHPGATDMLALAGAAGRDDLKMIVSKAPLIEALPHAGDRDDGCFIFASPDTGDRTSAVRQMIDHLRSGGAMALFPSTTLTPDLALRRPGSEIPLTETFGPWSPSIVLAMQRVPACLLQPAIVSGVIARRYADHPLVRVFPVAPGKPWQRQRLAEVLQIMAQLRTGDAMGISPRITFGHALAAGDLGNLRDRAAALAAIVARASETMAQHAGEFYGS